MATHSSVLAWRIPGMGSHRVRHNWSDSPAAVEGEKWEDIERPSAKAQAHKPYLKLKGLQENQELLHSYRKPSTHTEGPLYSTVVLQTAASEAGTLFRPHRTPRNSNTPLGKHQVCDALKGTLVTAEPHPAQLGIQTTTVYYNLKWVLKHLTSCRRKLWTHPYSEKMINGNPRCWRQAFSHVWLFATPWTVATRLLRPWDFPGKNIGVGCHFLLQRIFPTQGLNPGLPDCRQTLYHLSHQGRHFSELLSQNMQWLFTMVFSFNKHKY